MSTKLTKEEKNRLDALEKAILFSRLLDTKCYAKALAAINKATTGNEDLGWVDFRKVASEDLGFSEIKARQLYTALVRGEKPPGPTGPGW
jgi:hypothetical protein